MPGTRHIRSEYSSAFPGGVDRVRREFPGTEGEGSRPSFRFVGTRTAYCPSIRRKPQHSPILAIAGFLFNGAMSRALTYDVALRFAARRAWGPCAIRTRQTSPLPRWRELAHETPGCGDGPPGGQSTSSSTCLLGDRVPDAGHPNSCAAHWVRTARRARRLRSIDRFSWSRRSCSYLGCARVLGPLLAAC